MYLINCLGKNQIRIALISSLIFDKIFIVIQNIDNSIILRILIILIYHITHKINNIDFDISNINNINDIDNINDMIFDKDIVNMF